MSNSLRPHELYSSWNSPGQNTEVGSRSLLQEARQKTPHRQPPLALRLAGLLPGVLCLLIYCFNSWHIFSKESSNGSRDTSSVQFSHSVMANSLQPHGLQHYRLPCPSPTPGVYSNSYPLSRWCHLTISFYVIHFSSLLQSFPASGSFQMSQFFTSCGQSIGVAALVSVLPVTFRIDFLQDGLVGSPCSPRNSRESPPTPQFNKIVGFLKYFFWISFYRICIKHVVSKWRMDESASHPG